MVTIFLHPSLGKLSGAQQVPFVECLMQLDAAWLSRRINYPPVRFREVADGIIEAKNGVGLDDLLKPRHVELPHPGLLGYVSLPKLVGLLHQTLQGALTKPQWNSLVISAVNVVGDSKHVYAYMMDIFLIIVRQSPTVEKTIIDKLLPWLLETPDRSDMWEHHAMLGALVAALSVVSDSTNSALSHLELNGHTVVHFFVCLCDHALRQHDLQRAQVCLLEAINRYTDGRKIDFFDHGKELFKLLGAIKDDLGRAVRVGPPLQTALTTLDKLA